MLLQGWRKKGWGDNLEDSSCEYAPPADHSPQPAPPPQLKLEEDELVLLFWSLAENEAVIATHGSLAVPAIGSPPEPASVPVDFLPTPNTALACSSSSATMIVPAV